MRAAAVVVFLASFAVVLPNAAGAQENQRAGDAVGFDIAWNHVALSVPNIAESIAWYEKMLGFKGVVRGGQPNPNARQVVADLQARERHHRAVPAGGRGATARVEEEPVGR